MRTLAIVLLLGLAGGLGLLAFYGGTWKLLLLGVPVAAVLHWIVWREEIGADFRAGYYFSPLLHLGRDVAGVAFAWLVGHLLFLFFVGAIRL